jgi:rubrerythrin
MKRLLGLLMGAMLLMAVHSAWADDSASSVSAVSTPTVSATPVVKHKVKKTRKKTVKVAKTYVCPMDGYTSDRPGTCPKCGMGLVEKK